MKKRVKKSTQGGRKKGFGIARPAAKRKAGTKNPEKKCKSRRGHAAPSQSNRPKLRRSSWQTKVEITISDRIEGRLVRKRGRLMLGEKPGNAIARFKNRISEFSRAANAVGSRHRVAMLLTLLSGPATYRSLQRATKLRAGPLYHHVNQLRLASLIHPKERDLYQITQAGRNLMLLLLACGSFVAPRSGKVRLRKPAAG